MIKSVILCLVLLAFVGAVAAELPVQRVETAPNRITVTAVEFTVAPAFNCEVYYWYPDDVNQDGQIETCRGLEYNPCEPLDGQLQLIRAVTSGFVCDPPPPVECDGFSPEPPECDQ